jgi:hypothetical protein
VFYKLVAYFYLKIINMSKISIQPIPSTREDIKNMVQSFSKLNVSELELLVSEFNTLIEAKKAKSKKKRIEQLTKLIHQSALSTEKVNQYSELIEKLETKTMTQEENQTFLKLVEEDENLRNQRVAYMIELSQLQQVPFIEIREKFAFKTSENV